jgi:hypothetical protein
MSANDMKNLFCDVSYFRRRILKIRYEIQIIEASRVSIA